MKKFILMMVTLMTIPALAKFNDWQKFNSSLLIEVTRPNGTFTCTGVALGKRLIVTAAHCLEGKVDKVKVFLSSYYDPKLPSLAITNFTIHPNYDSKDSRYISDLAKIHLSEDLPSSINIYQVYRDKLITGDFYRFGFGERDKKNIRTAVTPTFKKVDLPIGIIELNDTFSRSGDSGGPIYIETNGKIMVLAVHSTFSYGPEGNYSLNPLLGSYTDWIFAN